MIKLSTFGKLSTLSPRFQTPHELVSHQFQRLFQSYAMAFNKQHNRTGTLFERPFKRCAVNSEQKLARLIFYHHSNPQYHGLCGDFRKYKWTSYPRYLLNRPSELPKGEVFNLLVDKKTFIASHEQLKQDLYEQAEWFIED